ncbi:MAG: DinB family protein [Chloroflexi bacterium]|nr:DinB family protein [Chloroflexota bacterium]
MVNYAVYLEIASEGRCMAHVLDLPGCTVRAATRDEVLQRLPDAIRAYHAWLRTHGEPAPPADEPLTYSVAGESSGFGPFDPGDAAALFPPDLPPITPTEIERYFRLMGYARADLLALVRDLPDEVLDWQPDAQSFPIRRLLRHIGNAEQWYVSRVVAQETLPTQWAHGEEMPLLEYLDMTRQTALARLRQTTEEERTRVTHPAYWTQHPEEPWTMRKALRRFLEHEREHTAQIRTVLAQWRAHLLAHLASERAKLWQLLVGLDEETLTQHPVFADWTAKDLLAHIAAWDEFHTQRVALLQVGQEADIPAVDLDEHNAVIHAQRRDWLLDRAVEACQSAREEFLQALASLTEEQLHRRLCLPWGETSARRWAQNRARHDAWHAADVHTWRQRLALPPRVGPKVVLLAALKAMHDELEHAVALVPAAERETRLVCGEWTLKDVVGHIADWERLAVEGLRQMAAGQAPRVERVRDIHTWNQAHVLARRDQPWEAVWQDVQTTHRDLMEVLQGMSQATLCQEFPAPWQPAATPYDWAVIILSHGRTHAADLETNPPYPLRRGEPT